MRDDSVRELELADNVTQKADAFRAALDQREAALGLRDRERQPGQPAAAADVGDVGAFQQRAQRKALDEMPIDDLVGAAHARQVMDRVPAQQQLDEPRERRALLRGDGEADRLEAAAKLGARKA